VLHVLKTRPHILIQRFSCTNIPRDRGKKPPKNLALLKPSIFPSDFEMIKWVKKTSVGGTP